MRPALVATTLAVCCAAACVPPAMALPSFTLSWTACGTAGVDQEWAGPGTYALEISGTGLDRPYTNAWFEIAFSPRRVVPAWDFSSIDYWTGQPGCQGGSRMAIVAPGGTCTAYPVTLYGGGMFEGSLTWDAPTLLFVQVTLDPTFAPDPAHRYALARVEFDHSHSVVGPTTPGSCGDVERAMCMVLRNAQVTAAGGGTVGVPLDSFLSWQDPSNTLRCPGATPVHASTWGALKAVYR